MDNFYIWANRQKDQCEKVTEEIEAFLRKNGKKVVADNSERIQREDIPADTQCILVLGGDGTMIRAAHEVLHTQIPMLGINLGTLGYLAEVEQSQLEPALNQLMGDNYILEERMMLKGTTPPHTENAWECVALNDVVLTRIGKLRLMEYKIYVNGKYLHSYQADGVIVSTPTGSTGYNLSVGGPIVKPSAELLVITPICPHTLNSRSIILSGEDHVMIEVGVGRRCEMEEAEVFFDADVSIPLHTGEAVHICKAESSVKMIKLSDLSFLEALGRKLGE
ncbi:MAG: NAD(+)/NADH kinase [Lachnospiraceae bacterium]|nr:NAD(+)/NADH kinase [Lachnospiraceae bacterium]